jgi:hypothetical protein
MNRRIFSALSISVVAILGLSACESAREEISEPDPTVFFAVNTLPYSYGDLAPVDQAYDLMTQERGWSPESAAAYKNFIVYDVIAKESGGCYNVRGGVKFANGGVGCQIARQGRGSDSGFGQLVSVHYRYPNGWLCQQEGMCSSEAITSTAYNSMTALLALVERSGKAGWCYSKWARSYHRGCATAPGTLPVLVG